MIVAMIAPSPLGLGTFEAGTNGMLTLLGTPIEAALSATRRGHFRALFGSVEAMLVSPSTN
jgi:uncharacterized membrane protein YbhN (UPF0104 family)